MKEFEFTLKFSIADNTDNPDAYIETLAQAGCDDAIIGIGQKGRIALQFNREAPTATEAITNAIKSVENAIPGAQLIEATPDLVGLSDVAEVLDCSRQYVRKLMLANTSSFPLPIHEGKTSLWHLANILDWLKQQGKYAAADTVADVAETNMELNIVGQIKRHLRKNPLRHNTYPGSQQS